MVRWRAPDGMNVFGSADAMYARDASSPFDIIGTQAVSVFPRGRVGGAIVVADVGPPVNKRVTIHVRDVDGLGFGCYGFLGQGQSIRFVGSHPQRSSLADSDVAVVGPGRYEGTIPGYGCWGDNYRAGATDYTVLFAAGGRTLGSDTFVTELPTSTFFNTQTVDVRTHEGIVERMHLLIANGTYFMGWSEPVRGPLAE